MPKPDKSDELMAALAEIITPARATEGVISLDIARVLLEPRSSFKSARSPDSSAGAFASERRELARRSSADVDVTLYLHPTLDELTVYVRDRRHGAHFEIHPQRRLALDVYYHPYAYADLADEYEKENRRAA